MTLKQLSMDHDYYCNNSNYYSNEAALEYRTWEEFYNEFGQADVDMNLCFRWDVKEILIGEEETPTGRYCMYVYIMGQRKGKFVPVSIGSVLEENIPSITKYLGMHWEKLDSIWSPISPKEDLSHLEEPYENAHP